MNIVLMANHFNTGGITSYLLNLSRGLALEGHQVWIASGGGNCTALLKDSMVKHVRLDIRVKSEVHPKMWLALPGLTGLVRRENIDIMHANTRVTQVMAAIASRRTGVPFVSTAHGFFKPRLFRRMFPCWGQGVIAISRGVCEHLINDFHLLTSQVHLIANGIDISQFIVLDEEGRRSRRRKWKVEGGPVVGIIARLSSVKGIDTLIKAFPAVMAQFPQARLWIVGEGPEEKYLRALVKHRHLASAVRFEAAVNHTADILPAFDVFVMPSLQEGLGLSVIEAQAAGVPVVASNVGGLPDLIEDGKTGLLVPAGDKDALAKNIIALLKEPQQAQAMAAAARRQAEEDFSMEQMVKETIVFYEQYTRR